MVMVMSYRKDMFAEAGLPNRLPKDWGEMVDWARKITNPADNNYGIGFWDIAELGWSR